MIPLDIQLKSIIYSFLYGVLFSILLNINYKYIYNSKRLSKLLINVFFILDNVFLYFIGLRNLNNGILNYYFILFIFLGFICVNGLTSKLIKH